MYRDVSLQNEYMNLLVMQSPMRRLSSIPLFQCVTQNLSIFTLCLAPYWEDLAYFSDFTHLQSNLYNL